MLPFLKKSQRDSNKFFTLEISSSYVRCLVMYQEESSCKIIGHDKQKLELGSVLSGTIIDQSDVEEAIKIAVVNATKDLEENIKQVIVGVTGDMCMGLMTTVRVNRGTKSPISKKDIDKIYKQLLEAAYMQVQNDYLNKTGNPDADLEVITTSNVYTKLDGKFIDELEGKEGKVIETAVFNSFCPKFHLRTLEKVIDASGLNLFAVGSETYSIAQQLNFASLENTDYVIIDTSNDSTNVAVVFGKGIAATRSLNIGYNHFIEDLGEKMGLTPMEAEKVLEAFISEKLTPGESAIVHSCLLETLDVWLQGLELLFGEFSGVKTFSPKVYLTGAATHIPNLVETVSEEPWMRSVPFKQPPDFKKLDFMDLSKINDATGRTNNSEWLPLACLSIIYSEITGVKYD